MDGCVFDRGWTSEAAADRFQIDAKPSASGGTDTSPRAPTAFRADHHGRTGHRTRRPNANRKGVYVRRQHR